ncbi:MAG: pilus assembly PilX N-terminal domain-containing protein [candidate division NC10 bacterium]|nr:pilus assembly PilX N-terminal domain-containing protein [candidate division NC10 bacterium]
MDGRRGRKGFIAVIALLIMAILLMFGVTFLTMATTENTMVTNGINGQIAFNIAEAGIDHAKRVLLDPINNNLNSILAAGPNQGILSFGASVNFAGGTYEVRVTNNTMAIGSIPADPSGSATIDNDKRVVVESTGKYRTATKVIRALVEIPAILDPPSSIYTLNGPDGGEPTEFTFNGNSFLVDGRDHNAGDTNPISGDPQKPPVPGEGVMACSTCNPGDTPLQEANGAVGQNQTNNITGAGTNPSIQVVTSSITASYLTTLKSYLIAHADVTYSGTTTIDGGSAIGTQTNPQITVVNGDLQFKGSASGFGILLVTGHFEMAGNATFQGIILVDGDDGMVEMKGTAQDGGKVWGSIIHINRSSSSNSGETRLRIEGNSQVYYSRQAIEDYGGGSLSSTTLAWSERT